MIRKSIQYVNNYRLIYKPGHPRQLHGSGFEGYVYEHILIAEEKIGKPLEKGEIVHHIDFNRSNNNPNNLLILTNSEHAKLHMELSGRKKYNKSKCKVCGKEIYERNKCCSMECSRIYSRKVEWPTKEQLEQDIKSMPWTHIGKKYGVTDNSVRKWARKYGLLK